METQKDRSLRRRIQSLQCFLFEQLHRELTQPSPSTPPGSGLPAKAPSEATLPTTNEPTNAPTDVTAPPLPHASPDDHVEQTSMQETAAAAVAATQHMTAADQSGIVSSDAGSRQQSASSSEQTAQQAAGAEPASKKSIIDATFGLAVRQRTKVTTGLQADKLRESRSFQVNICLPGPVAGTRACCG